jgi:hypothetical protein
MLYSDESPESGRGVSDHQRRVDELQAQVRREAPVARPVDFKPAPPQPAPSNDPLDHRIADELEEVRRHLDLLGGILVTDPILLGRHGTQLQAIDQISQMLGHLARVIAAEEKALAVEQVTLQELRVRLLRGPQPPAAPAGH